MNRQQKRHIPRNVAANAYTVAYNTAVVATAMDAAIKAVAPTSQHHEDAAKIISETLTFHGSAVMELCEKRMTPAEVESKATEFINTLALALRDAIEGTMSTAPTTALEAASLTVYLKAQGIPAAWDGATVDHAGQMTEAHLSEWRTAYPDAPAMLTQLRAVVRPILERAA